MRCFSPLSPSTPVGLKKSVTGSPLRIILCRSECTLIASGNMEGYACECKPYCANWWFEFPAVSAPQFAWDVLPSCRSCTSFLFHCGSTFSAHRNWFSCSMALSMAWLCTPLDYVRPSVCMCQLTGLQVVTRPERMRKSAPSEEILPWFDVPFIHFRCIIKHNMYDWSFFHHLSLLVTK